MEILYQKQRTFCVLLFSYFMMSVRKNKFRIWLTLFLLISCTSNRKKNSYVQFESEYTLEHTQYGTELFIKQGRIAATDSFLIVTSLQTPICKVYSIFDNMKEVTSYGSIGNGPNEFLQPLLTYSHNNTFGLNELNKKELAVIQLQNVGQDVSVIEKKRMKANTEKDNEEVFRTDYYFNRLDDAHYVSLLYEKNNKFYSLFDSTLTLIARFGESPVTEEVSPYVAVNRLQGKVAASEGTMVFATSNLPYLACYELKDNLMEKKWNLFYSQPYYKVQNGDVLFDKDKSFGKVLNIEMDAQYVYLLYLTSW